MIRVAPYALLSAVLLTAPVTLRAQADLIGADRPGIGNGPGVVGARVFQIELGVEGSRTDEGDFEQSDRFMPTLLRYGVTDRLELRLETSGFGKTRVESSTFDGKDSGLAPIAVGAKYQFFNREDHVFGAAGILGNVVLPSGSGAFRSEEIAADLSFMAELRPAPRWSIHPNVGFAFTNDDSDGGDLSPTASIDAEFELTERILPFVEVGVEAAADGAAAPVSADAGIAWIVRPDTQLDFAVGHGLAGDSPDFFWTVGVSHRFRF